MIDLSFLEEFTKGNTTKMKRYISMYLKMAPETIERMRQNIETQSWEELAVNAHSLKPQADYVGISSLKEVLIEIENSVKTKQLNKLKGLYEKAKSIHTNSVASFQEFLNKN